MMPLFDKTVEGFGELFRQISYRHIGTSTIQSRAVAGLANNTLIFVCPVPLTLVEQPGMKLLNINLTPPKARATSFRI